MDDYSTGPQRISSRRCEWSGPGAQSCRHRCWGNLPYCHDHVLDSIKLMTLTCEAAKKRGTGPFARTLLKAGTWLVKLAITTAAGMGAAELQERYSADDDVPVAGAKKKAGKKKAGKKKAGKKKAG